MGADMALPFVLLGGPALLIFLIVQSVRKKHRHYALPVLLASTLSSWWAAASMEHHYTFFFFMYFIARAVFFGLLVGIGIGIWRIFKKRPDKSPQANEAARPTRMSEGSLFLKL